RPRALHLPPGLRSHERNAGAVYPRIIRPERRNTLLQGRHAGRRYNGTNLRTELSRMKTARTKAAIKVGLIQTACSPDLEANVRRTLQAAQRAVKQGACIICTQELFRSQYFCQVEDHKYFKWAEPIPGPTTKRFSEFAKRARAVVVTSLFERRAAGVYHNT